MAHPILARVQLVEEGQVRVDQCGDQLHVAVILVVTEHFVQNEFAVLALNESHEVGIGRVSASSFVQHLSSRQQGRHPN
eukprot:2614926-Pleurochrysis_carterae.AAC.2